MWSDKEIKLPNGSSIEFIDVGEFKPVVGYKWTNPIMSDHLSYYYVNDREVLKLDKCPEDYASLCGEYLLVTAYSGDQAKESWETYKHWMASTTNEERIQFLINQGGLD